MPTASFFKEELTKKLQLENSKNRTNSITYQQYDTPNKRVV